MPCDFFKGVSVMLSVRREVISGPKVDCQGSDPDTQCGNCVVSYPIAVYPKGCPRCGSKAGIPYRFKGRDGVLGGALPLSLWEKISQLISQVNGNRKK